jgi:DNA-binding beta-propeller fold protein YncE
LAQLVSDESANGINEALKRVSARQKKRLTLRVVGIAIAIIILAAAVLLLVQPPAQPPVDYCLNGIQDQGEEGIDCGGPCGESCEPVVVVRPYVDSAFVLPTSVSDIAIDPASGNLYVLDEMRHRIMLFDSEFNHIKNFGETSRQTADGGWNYESGGTTNDKLLFPASISIANNKVYVLDRVPRIQVFSKGLVGYEKTLGFPEGTSSVLPKLWDTPNADGGASSIAVSDDGKIFVSDEVSNAIAVFSSSMQLINSVSGSGQNGCSIPRQIAFSGGRLYAACSGSGDVKVFDSGLNYLDSISAGLTMPVAVAVLGGGKILVFDNADSRLMLFSPQGELLQEVGSLGGGRLQFYNAGSIKLGQDSGIYVAESGNNRIQVLTESLQFERFVEGIERTFNVSLAPFYPAVSPNGDIAFSDPINCKVIILGPSYGLKKVIGGKGFGNAEFNNPKGIAFDSNGNLFVSDAGNRRVQVFSPQYAYLRTIKDNELIWPLAISVSEEGKAFVVDDKFKKILIFNAQGEKTGEIGEKQGITLPLGVLAKGGKIYVTDDLEKTIEVFDSSLKRLETISGIDDKAGIRVEFNESLALDSAGNLLFCDNRNRKVMSYNFGDGELSSFGNFGTALQELSILEVAASGGLIAVTDMEYHRLKFFDSQGNEKKEITIADLS